MNKTSSQTNIRVSSIRDRINAIALCIYLLLLSSACSTRTPPNEIDLSILGLTFDPEPCWQGICPGSSTDSETIAALRHSPLFVDDSFQWNSGSWLDSEDSERLTWDCQNPFRRWCGHAVFSDNTLHYLSLLPNRDITIGEFISVYGPPDQAASFDDPWISECRLELIWTTLHVEITSNILKTCSDLMSQASLSGLSSELRISSMSLFSDFASAQVLDESKTDLFPWPGLDNSLVAQTQLIPGSYSIWAVLIISTLLAPIIGLLKPKIISPWIAFPIAGVGTFGPTLAFQFSDICIPTIGLWFINTALLGSFYIALIEGLRFIQRSKKAQLEIE